MASGWNNLFTPVKWTYIKNSACVFIHTYIAFILGQWTHLCVLFWTNECIFMCLLIRLSRSGKHAGWWGYEEREKGLIEFRAPTWYKQRVSARACSTLPCWVTARASRRVHEGQKGSMPDLPRGYSTERAAR